VNQEQQHSDDESYDAEDKLLPNQAIDFFFELYSLDSSESVFAANPKAAGSLTDAF
jgi:hypothetical protein